ncbi:MAG: hypothetical protein IIB99_03125 [Planctomycetes bacterium]|nr:hypothetical protein [Planctomycetota bacterium]
MTTVQQTIKKARRRLTTAAAIHRTGTAIAVAAGAGLVLLAVDRLANLNIAILVYLAVLGAGLVAGVVHSLMTRPELLAVAVRLDRGLGLRDRLGSAEAIRTGCVQDAGFAGLVQQDAERVAQALDIKSATPIVVTRGWIVAGGLIAALGLGFAFVPPLTRTTRGQDRAHTAEDQAELQQQQQEITQTIQEAIAAIDDDTLDDRMRDDVSSLQRLAEQLGNEGASSDEVAEARDRSAGELAALADRLAEQSQRNLRAAEAVAERFAGVEPADAPMSAQEFAEALRNGEFGEAADLLDELMASKEDLSAEQRSEVAEHLRDMSEQLTEPSDAAIDEQFDSAREALRDLGLDEQDVDDLLGDETSTDDLQRALEEADVDEDVAQELVDDIERSKQQQQVDKQADDEARSLSEAMEDVADQLERPEPKSSDQPPQPESNQLEDQREGRPAEQRSADRSSEQPDATTDEGGVAERREVAVEPAEGEQPQSPPSEPDDQQSGDQPEREVQERSAPPPGEPPGVQPQPSPDNGSRRSLQEMLRRLAGAQRDADKGQADSRRLRDAARKLADTLSEQEKQRFAEQWLREFGSKPGTDDAQRAETSPPESPIFRETETVDIGGDEAAKNIIARWLGDEVIEGEPQRTQRSGEVIRRAQSAAEQAVDQTAVPRRYHELIQRYFGKLDETVQRAASSSKSAPAEPAPNPTAKPDGS